MLSRVLPWHDPWSVEFTGERAAKEAVNIELGVELIETILAL